MENYDSEQEQVEDIKKWWKENGRSVIAGLVIGLGGMVGWKSWDQAWFTRRSMKTWDTMPTVTPALPSGWGWIELPC